MKRVMYICRIKACGLIARPTLKLHWGCVQPELLTHMLHPAAAGPTVIQIFCAIQLPLWLLPLVHFSQPRTYKKEKSQLAFQKYQGVRLKSMTLAAS